MTNLAGCPHCGRKVGIWRDSADNIPLGWLVRCSKCKMTVYFNEYKKSKVVEIWNSRYKQEQDD